ncbi:hypothetical protein L0337_32575 [candidate division KSB1 bacterium]|nr:hypothetical protein [candidate division KSB1 bacterium]
MKKFFDISHYEKIGTIHAALNQHANEALAELTEAQQATAKILFQTLPKPTLATAAFAGPATSVKLPPSVAPRRKRCWRLSKNFAPMADRFSCCLRKIRRTTRWWISRTKA